jgi:lysozyme
MSTITQADALRLLEREVRDLNLHVTRLVRVQLTYQQKAALISFTYNVGRTGFAESTLLRRLNRGDFSGAASELAGWVYAGGKPILHSRRQAELALWFRY